MGDDFPPKKFLIRLRGARARARGCRKTYMSMGGDLTPAAEDVDSIWAFLYWDGGFSVILGKVLMRDHPLRRLVVQVPWITRRSVAVELVANLCFDAVLTMLRFAADDEDLPGF